MRLGTSACALAVAPWLCGCAAVLGTKEKNFDLTSRPPAADVYADGNRVGSTPLKLKLSNTKDHTFVFRLPGYKEATCTLSRGTGAGWVILDILSGLIPIVIDAATNSWSQTRGSACSGTLEPIERGPTPPPQAVSQGNDRQLPPRDSAVAPSSGDTTAVGSTSASAADEIEIVDLTTRERRRQIIGDMVRIGMVQGVESREPGVVRAVIGTEFYTSGMKDFYFQRLADAYVPVSGRPSEAVIELWDRGQKFGEFARGEFRYGPRYSEPRGMHGAPAPEQPAPTLPYPRTDAPPPGGTARDSASARTDRVKRSGHGTFHLAVGLGAGSARLSCDDCGGPRFTELSGYLGVGWPVGETTLLGIESTGWVKSESGDTEQIYSLMGQLTGYLSRQSGVFLTAGLGLVGYHLGLDAGTLSANNLGFSGRLGIEVPSAGRVALIPYVGYVSTFGNANFKVSGEDVGLDARIDNIQFGVALGLR